jgi:hypothetical protein
MADRFDDWVEISDDTRVIGAIGFIGGRAAVIISYYDDYDADRNGTVSWGEWIIGKLSPISLGGTAITAVAMAARVNMDVIERDPSFGQEAARMFVKLADNMIVDGVYAAYFSRIVGLASSALSASLVTGTIKQFVVRKGMESAVSRAFKAALKN